MNLRTLVVTGGVMISNDALKHLTDGCTQLTVRIADRRTHSHTQADKLVEQTLLLMHFCACYYLRQGGYVFAGFCLSVCVLGR